MNKSDLLFFVIKAILAIIGSIIVFMVDDLTTKTMTIEGAIIVYFLFIIIFNQAVPFGSIREGKIK